MTDQQILDHAGIFIERHESGLYGVGTVRSVFAARRYFKTRRAAMDLCAGLGLWGQCVMRPRPHLIRDALALIFLAMLAYGCAITALAVPY
jgi:hypothetical protein